MTCALSDRENEISLKEMIVAKEFKETHVTNTH